MWALGLKGANSATDPHEQKWKYSEEVGVMPMIHLKKFWTPLELFGIQFYIDEDKIWYSKRPHRPMKKISRRAHD
jgi:hypothetical protein